MSKVAWSRFTEARTDEWDSGSRSGCRVGPLQVDLAEDGTPRQGKIFLENLTAEAGIKVGQSESVQWGTMLSTGTQ